MAAVVLVSRTWNGTNHKWSDATNWSGGAIPGAGEGAVIIQTPNSPVLDVDTAALAFLTVNAGGVLDVGAFTLTVTGAGTADPSSAIFLAFSSAGGSGTITLEEADRSGTSRSHTRPFTSRPWIRTIGGPAPSSR